MGPSPSTLENVTLSGVKARGVRVSLTNDTANGNIADVGVKFEFYGSPLTTDVTQTGKMVWRWLYSIYHFVGFRTFLQK